MDKIPSSEITPEHVYLSRRQFMRGAGLLLAGATAAACAPVAGPAPAAGQNAGQAPAGATAPNAPAGPGGAAQDAGPGATQATADELGAGLTSFKDVTNYNNYYEFSSGKEAVAPASRSFRTSPWTVEVGGMVQNPKTYGLEDLVRKFPPEERVYRLRCVEAWSMVIPWLGFPLKKLLDEVQPLGSAQYVRFQSLLDPQQMPGQQDNWYTWPYVEGLRIDEAMNDLAIMGTGLYGKTLLPQNGAPLRLVVPWKYGFKSIKAIVKIDLVADQPKSLWMNAAPEEYGFYANVNPDVPHPRWSQATERRIGELSRRKTLPFNGYAGQVASLYAGMDLKKNY